MGCSLIMAPRHIPLWKGNICIALTSRRGGSQEWGWQRARRGLAEGKKCLFRKLPA